MSEASFLTPPVGTNTCSPQPCQGRMPRAPGHPCWRCEGSSLGGSQQRFCSCRYFGCAGVLSEIFGRCCIEADPPKLQRCVWLGRVSRESRFLSKPRLLGFHILWFNSKPNAYGSARDCISFPLSHCFSDKCVSFLTLSHRQLWLIPGQGG